MQYTDILVNIIIFVVIAVPLILTAAFIGMFGEETVKNFEEPLWLSRMKRKHGAYLKWANSAHTEADGWWFKRRKFG